MTEIADRFEKYNPDVDVRISSGASNSLAQQLIAGASADLFLSAAPHWSDLVVDDLKSNSTTTESTTLLRNKMVLVVPVENPGGVASLSDLKESRCRRVAVGGKNVPAGQYASEVLENAGVFEQLVEASKLVRGSDVRVVLAYAERGEVDAAIVYTTDARASTKVKIVQHIDESLHQPILYKLTRIENPSNLDASTDFFAFMQSQVAREIFESLGFVPAQR